MIDLKLSTLFVHGAFSLALTDPFTVSAYDLLSFMMVSSLLPMVLLLYLSSFVIDCFNCSSTFTIFVSNIVLIDLRKSFSLTFLGLLGRIQGLLGLTSYSFNFVIIHACWCSISFIFCFSSVIWCLSSLVFSNELLSSVFKLRLSCKESITLCKLELMFTWLIHLRKSSGTGPAHVLPAYLRLPVLNTSNWYAGSSVHR